MLGSHVPALFSNQIMTRCGSDEETSEPMLLVAVLFQDQNGLSIVVLASAAMVATEPPVVSRLKREDFRRCKHDSEFSTWKILIGSSDWKDHAAGKEGVERYRVHNLPLSCNCPGVYELGICMFPDGFDREVRKLDRDPIVVVYLGQAENIRARLQHYGRSGAHLANVDPTVDLKNGTVMPLQRGFGLFEEAFSRGCSIVFRWAPMESKKYAEKTESQLLNKFDYAWNKGSNGTRRPNDVLKKLEKTASSTPLFPSITRKFQMLGQKPVGIRIKASKPFMQEDFSTCQDTSSLLPRVFKFGRSQPRLVSDNVGVTGNSNSTCGVALGDGTVCERPPVQGNRRCAEHRGMKKKSSFSKPVPEGKLAYSEVKCPVNEELAISCGVILDDGLPCRRKPAQGRKRCEEHKGMRIDFSIPNSTKAGCHYNGTEYESKLQPETHSHYTSFSSKNYTITCGVDLGHGSFCQRPAVEGRQRCEEHKGMRISSLVTKLAAKEKSPVSDMVPFITSCSHSLTCGVTLSDGSFCKRQPVEGNKRCWQHKGMRVNGSSGYGYGPETIVCGVMLQNGSVCSRAPVYGRKRCEQHKGMRVVR